VVDFAVILKQLTTKYDNLLRPLSIFIRIHQSPTDGELHPDGIFTCILSTIIAFCNCKFMVGYEMMGESQRCTPEKVLKF
jgi:UDPglucose--hexose-1-phosphate uridylyltransferase